MQLDAPDPTRAGLLPAMQALALRSPDAPVVSMANERGRVTETLSRGQLWQQVERVAHHLLRSSSLAPGDRALLVYPPSLDFVIGFVGCLAAGVVPVPVYPPDPMRLAADLPAFLRVLRDADTRVVLCNGAYQRIRLLTGARALLTRDGVSWPDDLTWISTSSAMRGSWLRRGPGRKLPGPPALEDLAFLQYTSGSTTAPRGVGITFGNLAHQLQFNREQLQMGGDAHALMWVPPYHDFGLISGILSALVGNCRLTMLSPLDFIRRPAAWMELLHRTGATHTAAPDFGYKLVVRKTTAEQRAEWDLSRLRVVMSAAEPVRPATARQFLEAFRPSGLRPEAFCPAYGLAEHTVGVTLGGRGELRLDRATLEKERWARPAQPGADAVHLLGCGAPMGDIKLRIVDPETRRGLPQGRVGEIWVDSPSKAPSYWGQPTLSREMLHARLDGEVPPGSWLRTGDLGFLQDNELYVCGRRKDLLILAGRNLAPQDVEDSVSEAHPLLRPGGVAAFSVETAQGEALGLLLEARSADAAPERLRELAERARSIVLRRHPVPVMVVVVGPPGSVSKTSSGKIQRGRCSERYRDGSLLEQALLVDVHETGRSDEQPAGAPRTGVPADLSLLIRLAAETLGLPEESLDADVPLAAQGMGSLAAVDFAERLSSVLGEEVPVALLFDHSTPRSLAAALSGTSAPRRQAARGPAEPIAVIGLSCRFPGEASDPEGFWSLLERGSDAVGEVPSWRWKVADWFDPDPAAPGRTISRWGGFLNELRDFDAEFFGFSAPEAATVDPQERLLLETAWEALERAGQRPDSLQGSATGVYVGLTGFEYQVQLLEDPQRIGGWSLMNSTHSGIVGRLSYRLGLEGPNVALDTACSSSLVAIHAACQALRAGECEVALAGGVNVLLDPRGFVALSKAGALSPTGRCRTFSSEADGYVRAEGCGVLVLKPLAQAQADGDTVLAVIRGSAVNQDGRSNGFTAPSGRAQEALIRAALHQAGLAAGDIDYVECHGTGTPLGDPIEVQALAQVFGEREPPLLVGSVKSQIGHAEAAAGVAGVIKTILALRARRVPASLHAETLNPRIPWEELPIEVVRVGRDWPRRGGPGRAGVSAFGLSGTNAHIVLEEAPAAPHRPARAPVELPVLLSGHSPQALADNAAALAEHLDGERPSLPDLAWTLAVCRTPQRHRAVVSATPQDANVGYPALRSALVDLAQARPGSPGLLRSPEGHRPGALVVMLPGQGSLSRGALHELFERPGFEAFRSAFRQAAAACAVHLGQDLVAVLDSPEALRAASTFQPALFAAETALFRQWQAWGLEPSLLLGHSLGELVAAHLAGVLDLENAARLVCARGRLTEELGRPGGVMATLACSETELLAWLQDLDPELREGLTLAAVNAPRRCTVSGDAGAVDALLGRAREHHRPADLLDVGLAFHSPHMDDVLGPFGEVARSLSYHSPALPIVSTVTGLRADPQVGDLVTAEYWVRQLRAPVRFASALRAAHSGGGRCFLDLGARPVLSALVAETLSEEHARGEVLTVPTLRPRRSAARALRVAQARVHLAGYALGWRACLSVCPGARVDLPTSRFQRKRAWVGRAASRGAGPRSSPLLRPALDVAGVGRVHDLPFDQSFSWLGQHVVGREALLPFSWYLAWLASVGRSWAGQEAVTVRDLRLARPCPWTESSRLQALIDEEGGVRVLHRQPEGWVELATARFERGFPEATANTEPLEGEQIEPESVYAELRARGLSYGPCFRRARSFTSRGFQEAGARLEPLLAPEGLGLHPALLDAAFHPSALLLGGRGRTALPVGMAAYAELRPSATVVWSRVRRTGRTRDGEPVLDLDLGDTQGPVVCLSGLQLRPLHLHRSRVVRRLWEPLPVPEPSRPEAALQLLAPGTLGQELARRLLAQDFAVRIVELEGIEPTGGPILWLIDPETSTPASLAQAQALVRHVGRGRGSPPVITLTFRALALDDLPPNPAAAALWGYLRSVRHEHEGAWRLRDLDELPEGALLTALLAAPDELALRGGTLRHPVDHPALGLAAAPSPGLAQVARHNGEGLLDKVGLDEVPVPMPGRGQVCVEVRAAALNFRDVLTSLGEVPGAADGRLGGECAGRVLTVGDGVEGFRPGDRVLGMGPGSLGTHALLDARELALAPAGLSWAQAATVPIAFTTAWYALVVIGQLQPGERVLIHAAAGGVGMAAVQIAQALGADILATAHPSKWARLRELGIERLASSRDAGFAAVFTEQLGHRPVDLVLDAFTGELVDAGLGLLRPGGRFIEIGSRDIRDPEEVRRRWDVRYLSFDLAQASAELRGGLLSQVLAHVASGKLRPLPHRAYPLGALPRALRWLASARHVGKVVLEVPEPGGTALITGGLGALGQQVAQWLVERRGVDLLVLVGRGASRDQLDPRLLELEARGCRVELVAADVSRLTEVEDLVERCRPRLRWVVHAAGVLEDGLAARQSAASRARVLAPKLAGVRHLDACTQELDLAGFVAFGSAAARFGSPGQSAYAAASAAMEAVVAARKARGQRACTVAWGPWEGGGMAGSRKVQRNLRRLGIGLLEPADALARLDEVLWSADGDLAILARVAATARARTPVVGHSEKPWPEQVRAAASAVLGVAAEDLDLTRPLSEYGVDSLLAIELCNAMNNLSGRELVLDQVRGEATLQDLIAALGA
jgi:acyl transferase domain-containing protein/acyl-CoA synthetase (AMP-forming)/AMP-acid ligase II/NAD(P)-dependent dehydrogenase (short-subunit alcohol dehydrogenase family)